MSEANVVDTSPIICPVCNLVRYGNYDHRHDFGKYRVFYDIRPSGKLKVDIRMILDNYNLSPSLLILNRWIKLDETKIERLLLLL